MPILKHAKKKLKQDKKRAIANKKVKNTFKLAVKKATAEKSAKSVSTAFKAVDKAVKKNIIHKNKAARMKSSLSKLVGGAKTTTASAKPTIVKKGVKPVAKKVKTPAKKSSPKKK